MNASHTYPAAMVQEGADLIFCCTLLVNSWNQITFKSCAGGTLANLLQGKTQRVFMRIKPARSYTYLCIHAYVYTYIGIFARTCIR